MLNGKEQQELQWKKTKQNWQTSDKSWRKIRIYFEIHLLFSGECTFTLRLFIYLFIFLISFQVCASDSSSYLNLSGATGFCISVLCCEILDIKDFFCKYIPVQIVGFWSVLFIIHMPQWSRNCIFFFLCAQSKMCELMSVTDWGFLFLANIPGKRQTKWTDNAEILL